MQSPHGMKAWWAAGIVTPVFALAAVWAIPISLIWWATTDWGWHWSFAIVALTIVFFVNGRVNILGYLKTLEPTEAAILLLLSKRTRIMLREGVNWIPSGCSIEIVQVKLEDIELPMSPELTADGVEVFYTATIRVKISNIFRYMDVSDPRNQIAMSARSAFRQAITGRDAIDLARTNSGGSDLRHEVIQLLSSDLERLGYTLDDVLVRDLKIPENIQKYAAHLKIISGLHPDIPKKEILQVLASKDFKVRINKIESDTIKDILPDLAKIYLEYMSNKEK